jgi:hypothetical protein
MRDMLKDRSREDLPGTLPGFFQLREEKIHRENLDYRQR